MYSNKKSENKFYVYKIQKSKSKFYLINLDYQNFIFFKFKFMYLLILSIFSKNVLHLFFWLEN